MLMESVFTGFVSWWRINMRRKKNVNWKKRHETTKVKELERATEMQNECTVRSICIFTQRHECIECMECMECMECIHTIIIVLYSHSHSHSHSVLIGSRIIHIPSHQIWKAKKLLKAFRARERDCVHGCIEEKSTSPTIYYAKCIELSQRREHIQAFYMCTVGHATAKERIIKAANKQCETHIFALVWMWKGTRHIPHTLMFMSKYAFKPPTWFQLHFSTRHNNQQIRHSFSSTSVIFDSIYCFSFRLYAHPHTHTYIRIVSETDCDRKQSNR